MGGEMSELNHPCRMTCSGWDNGYEQGKSAVQSKLDKAVEALEKVEPIVAAAFWDQYTAGNMPGSGYNHKAQHQAGVAFGWKDSLGFEKWLQSLAEIRGK